MVRSITWMGAKYPNSGGCAAAGKGAYLGFMRGRRTIDANEACDSSLYHGSRDVRMGVFGVGTPRVCRGIRREQAGEFQGDDHENGMGQSPHLVARRREEPRWHGCKLGNRSGHAECPVPAWIHQGLTSAWHRDRDRWVPVERRDASSQRQGSYFLRRTQIVSRLLRNRCSV